MTVNIKESYLESSGGVVVRALASHQCGPGFDSHTRCHTWVEFVGSLLCSESFCSPGTPVFPSPQKPKFDLIWFQITVSSISASALEALI